MDLVAREKAKIRQNVMKTKFRSGIIYWQVFLDSSQQHQFSKACACFNQRPGCLRSCASHSTSACQNSEVASKLAGVWRGLIIFLSVWAAACTAVKIWSSGLKFAKPPKEHQQSVRYGCNWTSIHSSWCRFKKENKIQKYRWSQLPKNVKVCHFLNAYYLLPKPDFTSEWILRRMHRVESLNEDEYGTKWRFLIHTGQNRAAAAADHRKLQREGQNHPSTHKLLELRLKRKRQCDPTLNLPWRRHASSSVRTGVLLYASAWRSPAI